MPIKHIAFPVWMVILIACLMVDIRAEDRGGGLALKDRLAAAGELVKAKKYDAAEQTLQAIAQETGLSEPDKVLVERQLLALYTATKDGQKRTESAKKLLAMPNADTAAKVDALKNLIDSVDLGSQYYGWICAIRPKEEVDQMKKDYPVYLEEMARVDPAAIDYRILLGEWMVDSGEADKAEALFVELNGAEKVTDMQRAQIAIGRANAALLKGDRDTAVTLCKELVAANLKVPSARRHRPDPLGEANSYLAVAEFDLNHLKLPAYTGAKAFPNPQQARYSEDFVPLTEVKLVPGKEIKPDDIRLRLLRSKLEFFGVKIKETAAFTVQINVVAKPEAPEKPQGYALTVSKTGATINGRDAQGTLWGIVSFLQLFDRTQAPKIRLAEIVDYPTTEIRGFFQGYWAHALEFAIFCKLNAVASQSGPQLAYNDPTRPITPLLREIYRAQCAAFSAFGLRHYYGINPWTMFYPVPLSSERTFEMQRDICLEIAKYGGHIYYPYDDARFPMHAADVEKYGTAANIDAKHVTRLFRAVREQFPGFQMIFCPPFYWGPNGKNPYSESREDYLKSLGEFLDPEITPVWTGGWVKGSHKTKDMLNWLIGLTKHKPMIFQNASGRHNLLSYITDCMPEYLDWHDGYEGFFDRDIAGFMNNSHMPSDAADVVKMANCFWNPGAYLPEGDHPEGGVVRRGEASARRAIDLLFGKDMFDILDPAQEAMAYFDKYKYGEFKPEAIQELPELEKRLAIAQEAWKQAEAYNPFALKLFHGSLNRAIAEFAPNTIKAARKAAEAEAMKRAAAEKQKAEDNKTPAEKALDELEGNE